MSEDELIEYLEGEFAKWRDIMIKQINMSGENKTPMPPRISTSAFAQAMMDSEGEGPNVSENLKTWEHKACRDGCPLLRGEQEETKAGENPKWRCVPCEHGLTEISFEQCLILCSKAREIKDEWEGPK